MEDILQALNDIVRILDESQNPTWLLYLSALGPLILTAISVFIACRQHKQNRRPPWDAGFISAPAFEDDDTRLPFKRLTLLS